MPWRGWMAPGRKRYTALKGSRSSAFSVFPFTRAHMVRPCSVLSVPAPETYLLQQHRGVARLVGEYREIPKVGIERDYREHPHDSAQCHRRIQEQTAPADCA